MKEIVLTQGFVSLVDDEDYERINQFTWCANKQGNTYRAERKKWNSQRSCWVSDTIHWMILPPKPGYEIDHINGDELDNRRCNLRYATKSQQQANRKHTCGTSAYKGVFYDKSRNLARPYRAYINCNGVRKYLGYYSTETAAAEAYDLAAMDLFGEFAALNFSKELYG
jgi:hypothetical protein